MANKPINMKHLRAVLQLHIKGHSKRSIAKSSGLSRNTIKKYLNLFLSLGKDSEEVLELNDKELSQLFLKWEKKHPNQRLQNLYKFFPYMHKELRKTGVTRRLLWEEYISLFPDGFMSTQFCVYYNRWSRRVSPSMHIEYKAGDKILVDYSGKKLQIVDVKTGEATLVEVFVAILGASQMIYAEASPSQQKADFIHSCENALHFYGGVPQAIVTDNLKSAVTKSNRYEPKLNPDFADFASHYEISVLPTRAYKPKDKALVEGAVKIIYQQIYARLRSTVFNSLESLNDAIWHWLEQVNNRKLTGREYSRKAFFEEVEKETLACLPEDRFEIRNYLKVTVLQNGHVSLRADRHYYSVPYDFIRKKVLIAYTSSEVKLYYKYECIAVHQRDKRIYAYTTNPDHLASQHKQYTKWNPGYFLKWATSIDPVIADFITHILDKKQHPEQAYKSCMGVLTMHKKVGTDRFIKACEICLNLGRYTYGAVTSILDQGLDKIEHAPPPPPLPKHHNIRGKKYYSPIKNSSNEQRDID